MKSFLFLVFILISPLLHAADYVIESPNEGDTLTVRSSVGTNLVGGSVQIKAQGDGGFIMSSENQSDININSSGNTVLWPQTEGYQVITYGDSLLVQTQFGLQLLQTDSAPTCDGYRAGTLYYLGGGTGVADLLKVCVKLADDSFSWKNLSF